MESSTKSPSGSLAAAAAALEGEIQRYASFVTELERMPVNSDKTLQRARKMLEECATREAKLAELLPAFAKAMGEVQAAQQHCMSATERATERIRLRFEERMALLGKVAELGERSRTISEPVAAVLASDGSAGTSPDLLKSLEEIDARTTDIIAEAETLRDAAKEGAWEDIERDADTLRQQLLAARNKVLLAHRNLAARSPS